MSMYNIYYSLLQCTDSVKLMLYHILLLINHPTNKNDTITKNMIAKTINRIGIPHGYFLDLLDISIPYEYAKCYYFNI